MRAVAWLTGLVLALAAAGAQPVERDSRRDSGRRNTEQPRDHDSYARRSSDVESLSREDRRSELFKEEGKDPRTGQERGYTLRWYVALHPTVEACREQMLAQEAISRSPRRGEEMAEKRDYRALYIDSRTADEVTYETIWENRKQILDWMKTGTEETLDIHYNLFKEPLGRGLSRDAGGRLDPYQPLWISYSNTVRLRRDGGDPRGHFVRESFPTNVAVESYMMKGIMTDHGIARQSLQPEALALKAEAERGVHLWKMGATKESAISDAQFWAFRHPSTDGFENGYGIPEKSAEKRNFFESGRLLPGAEFITRPAEGIGENTGGWIELVVRRGGVRVDTFRYEPKVQVDKR